ncbi:MAG: Glutathione transport system permease protein GsiD [Betaproteobacteria bacterium ADurb.Bin341]|nr:MAG: Glutathione transport system permease protein GsiD [Betaproteobacteria bacterium ADurb.Bin341]HOG01672.1 ABC transporter permease subunit [Clostridia bacterium]
MKDKKERTEKSDIRTPFSDFIRKFMKQKTAVAAAAVLVLIVLAAVFADLIAPFGINEYSYDDQLQGPSAKHLFGTDEFGRDIFSRIVYGARISLSIGFGAVTLAAIFGAILGLIAGYYGGVWDSLISRICDVLFAFPGLILAIAIVAILGPGLYNVVIAVIVFRTPTFARLARGATLQMKNSVYVQAARSLGASDLRILTRHILPSALPSMIVQYSISIGGSIMTAASLSFLGMGASPPTPEWGLMLSNARTYVFMSWHYALFPGLAIFLTVLCFNHMGDGLRSALDPKLSD